MSENKVLSREDILAMEPGRELDALVAEKVMGWEVNPHNPDYHIQYTDEHGNPYGMQMSEFEPSTDISAVWEVVEHMQGLRELHSKKVRLMVKVIVIRGAYTVSIIDYLGGDKCLGEEIESTAPEAICKAALLAVMEGDNNK